ncbi:MAG: AAA family ATPase [Flavobacteriales bacterium]|nr:AAA family ATPase [Flavobacteriales bacterium]
MTIISKNSIIRIAITGPESSGKSYLAEKLANHFETSFSPEYARAFLAENGSRYVQKDLEEICLGQIKKDEEALSKANGICFFDTDMLVLKIWSIVKYHSVSPTIRKAVAERHYDHYLLCMPDLPWEPDHLRENPSKEERLELFEMYCGELEKSCLPYTVIKGGGNSRTESAIKAIKHLL